MSTTPPSGVLTFLFTDLENSTTLWEQFPAAMQDALAAHDALLRQVIIDHGGHVVKTTGDGLHAVFESANASVAAAFDIQQAVGTAAWPEETGPLKVRVGLHTGESQEREGDYYGASVNFAARVMGLGHGGQVLLSGVTEALVRNSLPKKCHLEDLGSHRMKGIAEAAKIYQLSHSELEQSFPPLKSLSLLKHNLPGHLSNFIGRGIELQKIEEQLVKTQLLTLLGPGGTGKTRLMLQSAEELIEDFSDGVWFVDLAPLTDPDLIPERVAAVLKVADQPGKTTLEALVDFIKPKELLLLLDNVEHLVRESAVLAEHLLLHCPKLKILVTGREALFITGEVTLQIPSMSLPDFKQDGSDLEALKKCEAVQFFIERARAVRPNFDLDQKNAAALTEIVRRLDGIPLAIELAAARLRMLTVEKINERLNDRFRLLTGGRRTALPRQQTLQALIDWSWNLLDENERTLLQRLTVFSGGWSLEAAEAICGYEPLADIDVFDGLEQLINKSLVTVEYLPGGEPRYGLLESIRQYAQDRLFEAQQAAELRDRHADYFASLMEQADQYLNSADMMYWVGRLRRNLDNLDAAIEWLLDDRPHLALQMVAVLSHENGFWLSPHQGISWVNGVVERTRPLFEAGSPEIIDADYIGALISLGTFRGIIGLVSGPEFEVVEDALQIAKERGEDRLWVQAVMLSFLASSFSLSPSQLQSLEEAIQISRKKNYRYELSMCLLIHGGLGMINGNLESSEEYIEEAMALIPDNGNPRMRARILDIKGHLRNFSGHSEDALEFFYQAEEKFKLIDDMLRMNMTRSSIAHLLRNLGKLDEARAYYKETILAFQEQGHLPAVAHQLECFGYIDIGQEKYDRGAKLLGAAQQARKELNAAIESPIELKDWHQGLEILAEKLGEASRDARMAQGASMNLEYAVRFALDAP